MTFSEVSERQFGELAVEDFGLGIKPVEQEAVFGRFYTGASEKSATKSGTGLGLSIAHLVIERSGGEIFFASNRTVGTSCIIRLPIQHTSDQERIQDA